MFLLTKRKPRLAGAVVTIRVLANERAAGGNARRRGWGKGVDIEHATGIRQLIGTWTRRILRSGRDQASTETKGRHLGEGLDGTRGGCCACLREVGHGKRDRKRIGPIQHAVSGIRSGPWMRLLLSQRRHTDAIGISTLRCFVWATLSKNTPLDPEATRNRCVVGEHSYPL